MKIDLKSMGIGLAAVRCGGVVLQTCTKNALT